MTATDTPQAPPRPAEDDRPLGVVPAHRRRTVRSRVSAWTARHRESLMVLSPLLLLAGVVQAWGMSRAPEAVDDEGTYTAQAYAVEHLGRLAHYTYWYDHPPLGWLQIAGWTTLTDAFDRYSSAVSAGREAMLVAQLVSVVLVWALARRMHLTRAASALAVALFALTPLALAFHRMVYLDNVAVPWLLAAFVLAAPRRNELLSFTGAAGCFAVAVLTKETVVLLAPVLLWWAWRHAAPSTRRYTFTVAGSLFVLLCCGYLAFAVLRGELLPGADHVSLIDGIRFQLFSRTPSGFVLDRESQAWATAAIWLHYDVLLPVVATLAALALLLSPRRRPIALAFLLQVVLLLRPGYLPVPYVIAMLPFAALSVAAAVDLGVRHHPHRQAGVRTALVVAAAIGAALTLGFAVPAWTRGDSALMTRDTDHPMVAAEAWLQQHAGPHDRLLVDDAVWVDLVRSGLPRSNVVWYYKADTDPDVMRLTPHGWRDYRYVLVTASMRRSLESEGVAAGGGQYPVLANAVRHSTVVASYGQDQNEVQVRRVVATSGGAAR